MSRSGDRFNWVGATSPNTKGGRRAHPPRAWEVLDRRINKKEKIMAYNSGLTASTMPGFIEKKYNLKLSTHLPVVFSSDILKSKTKELFRILKEIFGEQAFEKILQRKEVRAGKGKTRGRRYKSNAGLVFVVASDEELKVTGIDVVKVWDLKIADLAPNGLPGRFICYTEKAIKEISERFSGGRN
jgi:large subunit ribosomal protein L4e